MTSYQKKLEEELIIKHFKDHYGDFPKGRLVKSESPDFILRLNPKRSIGIELTRLHSLNQNSENSIDLQISREIILQSLTSKEEKLKLYRKKKIDLIWLIMTVDSLDRTASLDIQDLTKNLNINSSFNKIFLFELLTNDIFVLK